MPEENTGREAPDPGWPEETERFRLALAALGQKQRFRICLLLLERPRSVGSLVEATGMPQPLVSHHLSVLRHAGLIAPEPRTRGGDLHLSGSAEGAAPILLGLLRKRAGEGERAAGAREPGYAAEPARPGPADNGELEDFLL